MKPKSAAKEKITYEKLLLNYRLFKDLMDNVPDVIYFKDRQGRLVKVNKAHARGLGLAEEKVAGLTDFDIFPKKRAEVMRKDDESVMAKAEPIIDKVERSTRADGVDNYVSTTKVPRYDAQGRVIGLVGITRDVTHRKQLEQLKDERDHIKEKLLSLEEIDKMKSEFLSIVSHELRTPLAIVKEGVSLLLDGVTGKLSRAQKKILLSANDNVRRLKKIIDELLDISRIEKKKIRLRYSLVNLNDLVRDAAAYFEKTAREKGLSLAYHLPRKETNILLDAERAVQVVSNLLDNAIKFTEAGGRIDLELKVYQDRARIGVTDTGIGIAKADLQKLFNRFVQVAGPTGAKNKGIGLGLSIIKELVAQHGGDIWAESRPGIGSKFYFTLPRIYSAGALDKAVRNRINGLLDKANTVALVSLLIINYRDFARVIEPKDSVLFAELDALVRGVLKRNFGSRHDDHEYFATDFYAGECNIFLPEAKEKDAALLCRCLKDAMAAYFRKNKIENTFINIGIMDVPSKARETASIEASANVRIKKINIGLQKRYFARFAYRLDFQIITAENKTEAASTLDISEGGLCFVTNRRLETNANLRVKLNLPEQESPLPVITGRVAWIKETESSEHKYKIGLEFIHLSRENHQAISKLIKNVSSFWSRKKVNQRE
ncbi:MAG: ATP-binding protein [Candidatus Omnitrophota bacterium]|nr:ATP-binding protein [Candidatus Omnitrophota bacterium]